MATILTNKYGISDAIVKACMIDNHKTVGDISCTALIDAPQIRLLRRKFDIEEDVSDRIWALMGTAVHYVIDLGEITNVEARKILQAAEVLMKHDQKKAAEFMYKFVQENYPDHKDANILTETTLSYTIDGFTFSGTFDRFTIDKGLLDDYKNTSVYAYINEESRKKWIAQLNVYAFLLREHGYTVNEAQITAIFRDFSPSRRTMKGYPQAPVATFPIKLQSHAFMMEYITKRIKIHKTAEFNDELPPCNTKERWATNDTFAVKSPGRKNAIRVFAEKPLAEAFILGDGATYKNAYVETRPGDSLRCDSYCAVRAVCPQNKERLALMQGTKQSKTETPAE